MVPARLRQRRSYPPLGNLKTCELIATQNGSDGERGDTAGLFHEYAGRRPEPGVAINKGSDEAQEKLGTDAQAGTTTGSKRNTGVEGVFGKPQTAEPNRLGALRKQRHAHMSRALGDRRGDAPNAISCPSKP